MDKTVTEHLAALKREKAGYEARVDGARDDDTKARYTERAKQVDDEIARITKAKAVHAPQNTKG